MGAAISIAVGVGVYKAVKHQKKKRRAKKARRAAVALSLRTGGVPPYEANDSGRGRDATRRKKRLFGRRDRRLGRKLTGANGGRHGSEGALGIQNHHFGSDTTLVHGSPPPYSKP